MTTITKLMALGVSSLTMWMAGCANAPPPGSAPPTDIPTQTPVEIGEPLYPATPLRATNTITPVGEALTIPALVTAEIRQQVPALVDGALDVIGTPLTENPPPADVDIVFSPRDNKRSQPHQRLREGDVVRENQILARIDEQLVAIQKQTSQAIMAKSKEAIATASKGAEMQREIADLLPRAAVTRSEILDKESLVTRYIENRISAEREYEKANGEYLTADTQLRRHFIFAPFNGRVVRIVKSPQEFVKAGETVLELQSIDRFRVEGKLDVSLGDRVTRGSRVVVEPSRSAGPSPFTINHRQEITGIAITGHKGRPLIVSAGLDSSALVWDVTKTKATHRLPHPTGVRSVAATGPAAKTQFIATGADDGVVRLWDVSNPDKLPTEPTPCAESHAGAITASAFSSDGKYLATASGRDVFVWNVAERKRMYTLPADHRDAVTTVRFTPQCTLVTASKDKSIRIYKLGDKAATTQAVIDHRGGAVDQLGVSEDGSRVIFDKDASRLDVVNLADERSLGTVQTAGGMDRFATLAVFSPNGQAILTTGGDMDTAGDLTVWQTPENGGRAAELRRLTTPRSAPVTCAAFSPDPTHNFIAVGTLTGQVYFWMQSDTAMTSQPLIGVVTSVIPESAKTLAVRVEVAVPADGDSEPPTDRSRATIIVPPEGVKLPPPTRPTPPAPAPTIPTVGVPAAAPPVVLPAAATGPGLVQPAAAATPAPPVAPPK